MRARGWWPLLAVAAALLAWLAWPGRDGAAQEAATGSRGAPPEAARRAAPLAAAPAQPAAPAFGARRTGIAACDDLVDRTMTCAQLPDDARIAVAEASKAWARVEGASRRDLEASCRATAAVQGDALAAMGC
ncbi:MAG TPA: hypothetical protein VFU21_11700 [Kofleriaceae bacterium]|nr:hypothetical protein [Kofleriaceae bacterium]